MRYCKQSAQKQPTIISTSSTPHKDKLRIKFDFSESTQVVPNAPLCKALMDRITDRAHIIKTGTKASASDEWPRKAGPRPTG